jgi:hypothetical protein
LGSRSTALNSITPSNARTSLSIVAPRISRCWRLVPGPGGLLPYGRGSAPAQNRARRQAEELDQAVRSTRSWSVFTDGRIAEFRQRATNAGLSGMNARTAGMPPAGVRSASHTQHSAGTWH